MLRNLPPPHTGKVQDQVQGFFSLGKCQGRRFKPLTVKASPVPISYDTYNVSGSIFFIIMSSKNGSNLLCAHYE